EHGMEIVRERVVVVSASRIVRAATSARIEGDTPQAGIDEPRHLVFPHVAAETPAVKEHDRHAGAPVAVEKVAAVMGLDVRHHAYLRLPVLRRSATSRTALRSNGVVLEQSEVEEIIMAFSFALKWRHHEASPAGCRLPA